MKKPVKKIKYERVEVEFHGQRIETFWDGENAWVSVKRICDNLGLAAWNQVKKVKNNQSYRDLHHAIMVEHPSGAKETFCLHLKALTLWLGSIQPNRVREEIRAALIQYQRECMDVLTEHFFGGDSDKTTPLTAAEQLLQTAQVMVEHEQRIVEVERRLDAQEERQRRAARELLALPQPEDLPEPRTLRSVLVERMRRVVEINELKHRETWNKLYSEYKYRSHIDLKARAKNQDKRAIDVAEELGVLAKLYDLCCYLWPIDFDDINSDTANQLGVQ